MNATTELNLLPLIAVLRDVEHVHPSTPHWVAVRDVMHGVGRDPATLAPIVQLLTTETLPVAENAMFALREAGVDAWGVGHGREFRFEVAFPDGPTITVVPAEFPTTVDDVDDERLYRRLRAHLEVDEFLTGLQVWTRLVTVPMPDLTALVAAIAGPSAALAATAEDVRQDLELSIRNHFAHSLHDVRVDFPDIAAAFLKIYNEMRLEPTDESRSA